MAVIPICYNMHYKDHIYPIQNVTAPNKTGSGGPNPSKGGVHYGGSAHNLVVTEVNLRKAVYNLKSNVRSNLNYNSKIEKLCSVWYASKSSTDEKKLGSLASNIGKLQGDENEQPSDSLNKTSELIDTGQFTLKKGLESLDSYFEKLNESKNTTRMKMQGELFQDADSENHVSPTFDEQTTESNMVSTLFFTQDIHRYEAKKLKTNVKLRTKSVGTISEASQQQYDETSDLYLLSILASINIAVFLFEIASPIRNSNLELFSVPLLYGAKINHLILVGEWWRLITPMFLHSGLPHIALSCWALITFGRQVCRGYGSFAFFLIYILGGVSGNLISFLHTPEPTVGGTGPVFAIIGAWLIYQMQNKDVIAKDVSDDMFLKAITATAFSFIVSNVGTIDEWAHFGAALTGIAYGFFTAPTLQLDDAASRRGQEEGITLIRRYMDPCKSLILFTLFILVLSSLPFFIEPPLSTLATEDF